MNTDADQLEVYKMDKNKLQRDDMVAVDGEGKPQFTMNSKEEMKFDPDTGNVEVNSGAKGYRKRTNTARVICLDLQSLFEPPGPKQKKTERESEKVSNRHCHAANFTCVYRKWTKSTTYL
jgi:hypothetical protein